MCHVVVFVLVACYADERLVVAFMQVIDHERRLTYVLLAVINLFEFLDVEIKNILYVSCRYKFEILDIYHWYILKNVVLYMYKVYRKTYNSFESCIQDTFLALRTGLSALRINKLSNRCPRLHQYEPRNNINWRDVRKKNVVNHVDMSRLRAPWQNGPYKTNTRYQTKTGRTPRRSSYSEKHYFVFFGFSFFMIS